ncbi:MAG: hypothetical protein V7703_04955 [Hyphomicrobiales bacterium]
MDDEDCVSQFWRLADSVNIVQAALLIIGIEPQSMEEDIEFWGADKRPDGYIAVRDSVLSSVQSGVLDGAIEFETYETFSGGEAIDKDRISYRRSRVLVPSLIEWLEDRGFVTQAFAKPKDGPKGFRDPDHPRFSGKLVAVVEAWEQYDSESNEPGTPKQRLIKWLRLNASRYGLTDDDGKPSENVIEELAKVANWATIGGAPKTRSD